MYDRILTEWFQFSKFLYFINKLTLINKSLGEDQIFLGEKNSKEVVAFSKFLCAVLNILLIKMRKSKTFFEFFLRLCILYVYLLEQKICINTFTAARLCERMKALMDDATWYCVCTVYYFFFFFVPWPYDKRNLCSVINASDSGRWLLHDFGELKRGKQRVGDKRASGSDRPQRPRTADSARCIFNPFRLPYSYSSHWNALSA